MKLLLALVVILTVFNFKANCRIYTDGPDEDLNTDFTDDSQHLLTGSENPHTHDVDHQMKKDVNEENPIKLRGKADKKILKKLIENLESMEYKLTQANAEMKMDLQSLKENITGKMDSLVEINSNQDTQLDSIIDAIGNISLTQGNMKMDLQSLKENITGKMDSLIEINSNQDTQLDSIIDAIGNISLTQGCPNDMFLFGSGNGKQCFKFFNNSRMSWTAANTKCREENLVLAEPNDPISLRARLVMSYNPDDHTWLGGQGDGTSIRWLRSGNVISNTSPLWWPGLPGSSVTTADNLLLLTYKYHLDNHPSKPYYRRSGTYAQYALCELVMN